jgi:hypothetical protein
MSIEDMIKQAKEKSQKSETPELNVSEQKVKEFESKKPERHEDFLMMERKDEEQIMQEMQGRILPQFFYEFSSGGRIVTGLSYAGVKQIMRQMGNIRIRDFNISDDGNQFIAKARAVDENRNLEIWGVSQQPKKMTLRSGKEIFDEFAATKAASKAQRNAIRALIPEQVIVSAYEEWKRKKKVNTSL